MTISLAMVVESMSTLQEASLEAMQLKSSATGTKMAWTTGYAPTPGATAGESKASLRSNTEKSESMTTCGVAHLMSQLLI